MPSEAEMRMRRCCFAGPRIEVLGMEEEVLRPWLEKRIVDSIHDGYSTFITGMSMGSDILAGEIVVRFRARNENIRLIAISPYPGFEQKWKPEQRSRYRELIRDADLLKYAAPRYAEDAIEKRNDFMLRHSARIIAVEGKDSGSVKNMLENAALRGLDIVLCDGDAQDRLRCERLRSTPWPQNLLRAICGNDEIPQDADIRLTDALSKMEAEFSRVIRLRYRDAMTVKEIGDAMGIEPKDASLLLDKAMKKLRRRFGHICITEKA